MKSKMLFPTKMKPFPLVAVPNEPRLPTYEETTGIPDTGKLPSYKTTRRSRQKPYGRLFPAEEDEVLPLFNTIYDDERIELAVPPAPAVEQPVPPLEPRRPAAERRRATEIALAILNGFILLGPRRHTLETLNGL